jgi:diguanylate cyclase (GGDEF)-like protein
MVASSYTLFARLLPRDLPSKATSRFREGSQVSTVLVVDDEPQNRKLLEVMLQREGHLTVAAANGEEALTVIAQSPPDLILLDIKLPGMDGYQVAEALKSNPQTSNIPIIAVTVLVDRNARMAALKAGVEELVTKPIDPNELSLRVRNLLRLKAYGDLLHNQGERKKADEKIHRLNRVYAVLSGINSAIVRTREPGALFREICRVAVSDGGFSVARVVLLDADGKTRLAATSDRGHSQLFQRIIDEYNANPEHSQSFLALALRAGGPLISNDVAADPRIPNRAELTKEGNYALALLQITAGKRVVGVILLRAREAGAFDEDEMQLLLEVVGNLGFALENISRQRKLDYLAYYDELTGLANRSLFLERLAQHMRAAVTGGHKLALFFLDLERFRNINDSLGRPAGDAILVQAAEWLGRKTGDPNLLARLGSDQFAIVLPEIKQDGDVARLLAKRVREFLDHPFRLNGVEIRIAAKVGVALFPNDGTDADTLLKNAEAALKKAKARGDRVLFYTQAMNEAVAGNLTLENQLRLALENGEFVLHYQPKVNLDSGKLAGAEALIRWNDPQGGLVPPGRFIPILEVTGLIHDVGRLALRTAIAQFLSWRAAGLPAVRIAVNVSPLQLRSPGFIAELEQAIDIDPLAAAGLELEITESLIMEDVKNSIAKLLAIRAMGVTIAIDDFGTGFSSLSYLAKLPVDTLKIDRSFVIDMTAGPDGLALVTAIINLAHSLKLKVVAEGVETEEQSRLLRLLKCDEMQGFLFSKPVPGDLFEARFLALPVAA